VDFAHVGEEAWDLLLDLRHVQVCCLAECLNAFRLSLSICKLSTTNLFNVLGFENSLSFRVKWHPGHAFSCFYYPSVTLLPHQASTRSVPFPQQASTSSIPPTFVAPSVYYRSSLFTLFICTWTVQHLNIPVQHQDCETWQGVCKRTWKKLNWIIVTLVLPESLMGRVVQDFIMATKSCDQMKSYAEADGAPWSMVHAYFANMGGFVFRVHVSEQERFDEPLGTWIVCLAQSFFPEGRSKRVMNPIADENQCDEESDKSGQNPLPPSLETFRGHGIQALYSRQTCNKRQHNYYTSISKAIDMALQRNRHHSQCRSDSSRERTEGTQTASPNSRLCNPRQKQRRLIRKGVALIIVTWLIIQVIERGAKGLPISQIEIAVLAFSACTFLTYILSWSKPQNVDIPIYIHGEANIVKQWAIGTSFPFGPRKGIPGFWKSYPRG
jgi:hypothetical protein